MILALWFLLDGSDSRNSQPGFHMQDSKARIPQPRFLNLDATARIPRQSFHNQDCSENVVWVLALGSFFDY